MKNSTDMKSIEDIIRSNKDFFEDAEPSTGHLERFNRKLEKRFQVNTIKRSIVPYLLKAAVVTLLITLSSLWTWDHFIRTGSSRMTLGQVSPQYKEVENYYVHQVNLMEGEIVNVDLKNNPEQKTVLLKEMKSMDSTYVSLQKELKANPNDERIINAMIEHYQTKVEVMTYIVNQLKTIRNDNQNKKENEKVSL
jgi:predicted DNA-binding antitoxin AbrB/MazE fold protein